MFADDASTDQPPLDPVAPGRVDPAGLKGAHGRTGRMLKNAGLPFEDDEFDDEHDDGAEAGADDVPSADDDDSTSASSSEGATA